MIICQDMLGCDTVLIIHHTDCGGQHAAYHPAALLEHGKYLSKETFGVGEGGINMQPIYPGMLDAAVKDDVEALRGNPKVKSSTAIYGLVCDTATGKLREVCRG